MKKERYCECCGQVLFNRHKFAKYCKKCAEHKKRMIIDHHNLKVSHKLLLKKYDALIEQLVKDNDEKQKEGQVSK